MHTYNVNYPDWGSHEVQAGSAKQAAKIAPQQFNPELPGPVLANVEVSSKTDPSVTGTQMFPVKWVHVRNENVRDRPGQFLIVWETR